jgi:phage tail tape-measure protein
MKNTLSIAALGMLGLLAACGQNPQERTTGGAAAGAATGAAVGALAGPPGMAVGALVGGGAGAVTGAATKPSQVNLGKPPWTNPETRVPTPKGPVAPASGHYSRYNGRSDTSQNAEVDRLNEQSYQNAQGTNSYR